MYLPPPKGTRDFSPKEKILRDKIVSTIREVFEVYGFAPLETPLIERYETLSSKYAGGTEILKETFKLKDQGGRELGLRYDLTVPLARYIAGNPNIKLPFKRYQIGEVFRDGPVSTERFRQFLQCDADSVGSKSTLTDAEVIALANDVFKKLNLEVTIKINNRKILNDILLFNKIEREQLEPVILSLDKLKKFGEKTVKGELKKNGIKEKAIKSILKSININGNTNEKLKGIKKEIKNSEGIKEIAELLDYLDLMEVEAEFDASLARGLSYYTGTVFEASLKNSKTAFSVAGGGRYDKMISSLTGKTDYPAVGISFGIDRIYEALKESNMEIKKTLALVYVIPIGTLKESIKIVKKLRESKINSDIDLLGRSISKNLQYANSLGIPFVIFVGEDELKKGKLKLKDMKTGKEEMLKINDITNRLK